MPFRFISACLTVLAVSWSLPAHSYQTASALNYDPGTETLSGYNRTWKDPWDADYYYDCIGWVWDDVYGYTCTAFQTQINYAYVAGTSATNAPQFAPSFHSGAISDFSDAQLGISLDHVFTTSPSHRGEYTTFGDHYVIADLYVQYCPYNFCTPPLYVGSYWFHLGTTSAATPVCVVDQYVLDSAAIAVALGWPTAEPFERAVTMKCDGSTGLGVVTYLFFNDSFGVYYGYPTYDPCKSQQASGFPGHAASLHSHPYFYTTAEYNAVLGCHGDLVPRSFEFLQNVNAANEGISGQDLSGAPGDKYLKTPTGRVTRSNNNGIDVQVYP